MACKKCGSQRVAAISSYGRDCQNFSIGNKEETGYGYSGSGIARGDNLSFNYCLDCGQIQNDIFPLPLTEFEEEEDFEYDDGSTPNEAITNGGED